MKTRLLSVAFAFSAAIASASPAWTWDTYVPADWTASPENFLVGNAPTLSTGRYTENGKNLSAETLTLCDGTVPPAVGDYSGIFGIVNGTLTWTFDTARILHKLRFYTFWGDGGRDGVNINQIKVLYSGESDWSVLTSVPAYSVACGNNSSSAGALTVELADTDPSVFLASDIVGLQIVFGYQDNNGTGYAEIEADAPPAYDPRISASLLSPGYDSASWSASFPLIGIGASSADLYVSYGPDADHLDSSALLASGVAEGTPVIATLSGLFPETTYAYLLTATNSLGVAGTAPVSGTFTTAGTAALGRKGIGGDTVTDGADLITHVFTQSGSFRATSDIVADLLVVGGGGAGGWTISAGGGGGQVVITNSVRLQAGTTYTVTVGAGGRGTARGFQKAGGDGNPSSFGTLVTALGGGGGGGWEEPEGRTGASGGGGADGRFYPGRCIGGEPVSPATGHRGGDGAYDSAGGGGGAGGPGLPGVGSENYGNGKGGDGGPGLPCDYTGTLVYYGAGGGAGAGNKCATPGLGGSGTGGNGSAKDSGLPGEPGLANTGSGGGGGSYQPTTEGGDGGSGIVVVRYRSATFSSAGPVAEILSATDVTQTSATLRLRLACAGADGGLSSLSLAYAPNDVALPEATVLATGLAEGDIVDVPLAGLLPGAAYRVVVTAENALGATASATAAFSTAADTLFALPGLLQGKLSGNAIDTVSGIADASDVHRVLGPVMAYTFADPATAALYTNEVDGAVIAWDNYTTFLYTGRIYLEAGRTYVFGSNIDDVSYIVLDGNLLLNYNKNGYATCYVNAIGSGWHDLEIRFYNGIGGAGGNTGSDKGKFLIGFGYNTDAHFDDGYAGWTRLFDSGDGSFLSIPTDPADLTVAASSSLAGDFSATLRVNASEPVTLYAWYGAIYGGADPAAWDGVTAALGTAAAGIVSLNTAFTLPETARYVRFYAVSAASGDIVLASRTLLVDEFAAATADPVFRAEPASSIGVDRATLPIGVSNPGVGASACDLVAFFGLAPDRLTHTNLLASAQGVGSIDAVLAGLYPDRLYYVQVLATNALGGATLSDVQTFRTAALDEDADRHLDAPESLPGFWQAYGPTWSAIPDPRTSSTRDYIPEGALMTCAGNTTHIPFASFTAPSGITYTLSDNQFFVYDGYMYLEAGRTYTFGKCFDDGAAVTIAGETILDNGTWDAAVYASYTPEVSAWYPFNVRVWNGSSSWGVMIGNAFSLPYLGAGVAFSTNQTTVTTANYTSWHALTNTVDNVLFRTEPLWRSLDVNSASADAAGTLTATLAIGNPDGLVHDLYVAYGATYGGVSTGAWEHVERLAALPADATAYTDAGTVEDLFTDIHYVRYFIPYSDVTGHAWSETLVFGDAGTPSLGSSVAVLDGGRGDGFVIAGSLDSTGGSECTVTVEVSPNADLTDAFVWTALVSDEPASFACDIYTNDTASAAYIRPGSTVYYRLRAVNESGDFDETGIHAVTTPESSAFGAVSASTDMWTATFRGSLDVFGAGDTTTVWLLTGDSADALAPTGDPLVLTDAGAFSFDVTYPSLGATVAYGFLASNACSTAIWTPRSATGVITLADQATYYWKTDVAAGDWNDAANWDTVPDDPRLGYPNDASCTASFVQRGTNPTVVTLPGTYAVGTLDFGTANSDITFTAVDAETGILSAGRFAMQSGTHFTVHSARVENGTLWSVPTGVRCYVLDEGFLYVNHDGGEGIHFSYGDIRCELRGHSTLQSIGHISTDGPDVRIVIDDSTLRDDFYFVPARGANAVSNVVEFLGEAPKFTIAGACTPAWDAPATKHDITFLFHVPENGYAEAPIERVGSNKIFAGENQHGAKVRFEIAADSPVFQSGHAAIDVPLLSWTTYGIYSDLVELEEQPRPALASLYYKWGDALSGDGRPNAIWATLKGCGATVILLR